MVQTWICLLLAACSLVSATGDADYWNDYDNFYEYDDDAILDTIRKSLSEEKTGDDKPVEVEIQHFKEDNDTNIKDYQIEDNRSEEKQLVDEKIEVEPNNLNIESEQNQDSLNGIIEELSDQNFDNNDNYLLSDKESPRSQEDSINLESKGDSKKIDDTANDYALLWGDIQEQALRNPEKDTKLEGDEYIDDNFADDMQELDRNLSEADKKIIEETKEILEKTNDEFEHDNDTKDLQDNNSELKKENQESADIQIENNREEVDQKQKYVSNELNSLDENDILEDDTVDKVLTDLNDDLDKLFDTFAKLSDNDDYEEVDDNELEDALKMDVFDYEEKYQKPYREGLVLSQREDDINDNNLFDSSELKESDAQPFDELNIGNIKNDLNELRDIVDTLKEDTEDIPKDLIEEQNENPDAEIKMPYLNDAFVNNEGEEKRTTPKPEVTTTTTAAEVTTTEIQTTTESGEIKETTESKVSSEADTTTPEVVTTSSSSETLRVLSKMVDELNSAELDDITQQFVMLHEDILDPLSANFERNTDRVNITLSTDESVVVTSPNFPAAYPTTSFVDWYFEGDGMGIELNITELEVNGAMNHYLLVKPGAVDATGTDGIVFTYRLNSVRRFRFLNTNKMFVRFDGRGGIAFFRGFSMSVKSIAPLSVTLPPPVPAPLVVPPAPQASATLYLGGVSPRRFETVREQFRQILADMAKEYITENNIEQGLNTTLETTQILSVRQCNLYWPDSENCLEVEFGIPLVYEGDSASDYRLTEDDLHAIWATYIRRDPFAHQLTLLNIAVFPPPHARAALGWLLAASGALAGAGLLAAALWRFSCLEGYTRMKSTTDTESIPEKRDLDLYPTPHQALPPLFSDDYKWAERLDSSRVDMGGFANSGYTRNELFIDSDEEVERDRNAVKNSRDMYSDV